ncbi:hypothetical protein BDR06DRAFT_1007887 [Suillus hirtellus]|nr:hypothetical protein BDR06DRAFT_1007887 [Suillus hirtellus]
MAVLWKSHGFFCRGTVCYRVRNKEGEEYALKDCWVEESKKMHEPTVLRMLKGVPNIVELIDDWDVYYEGQPDCMARIRKKYGQDQRDDSAFCNRFHRRLLLSPCGVPLSQFSSRTELIVAFRHFVIAHQAMIERRVLHGDLSPNNFVIHNGIGYFIDFDHAAVLAVNATSTYSPGTGTMPYISIRILQSMRKMIDTNLDTNHPSRDDAPANAVQRLIEHRPSDDLESLFYIFFEFVAKYGGTHGELAPSWTQDSLPWASAYEALGKADLKGALGTCCFTKVGVVLDLTFMVQMTSDYFSTFKPLIQHWQALVCLTNMPDEKERVETTHDKVLEVLTTFINTYVEVPPINPSANSKPIPKVGSGGDNPRIGRPPITGGGSEGDNPCVGHPPITGGGSRGDNPRISYTINAFPAFPMPPRKRAKHSAPAAAPSRRSERSTQGVGGHVAQLQKTRETLAAPARKGRKEPIVQMSDSDAEENPMAPSQLQRTKKKNCSVTADSQVRSGSQLSCTPDIGLPTTQPLGRFGFKLPMSDIRKAPYSSGTTYARQATDEDDIEDRDFEHDRDSDLEHDRDIGLERNNGDEFEGSGENDNQDPDDNLMDHEDNQT